MNTKRGLWKRSVAGLLAFAMVLGLAAVGIPGLIPRTEAAQAMELPSYHVTNRDKKDGLYIFYPAGSAGLAMDVSAYGEQGQEINTVLDYANTDVTQRFVVQVDEKFTGAVTYGIRSINSAYWLGSAAAGDRVVQTGLRNYRDPACRWQFIANDDGTVLIKHYNTGKYFCWNGYGTANTLQAAPADGVFTDSYKWNMTQTHMQDAYFTAGIYWIETRLPSAAGVAPADTTLGTPKFVVGIENADYCARIEAYQPAAAGSENAETGEVTWTEPAEPYESQQFVIQKISGGFYSIVNVSTGCYLAVGTDGGIVNGRPSNLAPDPGERWIIYPGTQTGNTTVISTGSAADSSSLVSRFRIISAVDGRHSFFCKFKRRKVASKSLPGSFLLFLLCRFAGFLDPVQQQSPQNGHREASQAHPHGAGHNPCFNRFLVFEGESGNAADDPRDKHMPQENDQRMYAQPRKLLQPQAGVLRQPEKQGKPGDGQHRFRDN